MKLYTKILSLLFVLTLSTACKHNEKETTNYSTSTSASQDEPYTSKKTKADKKKYYDANDNVVYEIKYKPDGFKLRTASSKLLWKIKLYDDKIKISDNEENLDPYEIKIINSEEAKLVKNDAKLARLTNEEVKGAYFPSLLINEISEIPEDQKRIIMDELVLKGF